MSPNKILSAAAHKRTLIDLKQTFEKYVNKFSHKDGSNNPNIYTGLRSDFARLARRLLSKSGTV